MKGRRTSPAFFIVQKVVGEMTDYERSEIDRLRNSGMGYKAIAKELNISVNSIKTYCKRMNIKGERYLVEKTQVSETQIMEKDPEVDESDARCCLYCGSVIVQPKHGRKKKFCSNKCRAAYWRNHPEETNGAFLKKHICRCCGKVFYNYRDDSTDSCTDPTLMLQ